MLIWTCICDFISEKIDERNSDQDFTDPWSISGSLGFCLTVWKPPAWGPVLGGGDRLRKREGLQLSQLPLSWTPEDDSSDFCALSRGWYTAGPSYYTQWVVLLAHESLLTLLSPRKAGKVRIHKAFKAEQTKPEPLQITEPPANYRSVSRLCSNDDSFQDTA